MFVGDKFIDEMPMGWLCRLAHGDDWAERCLRRWSDGGGEETDEWLRERTAAELGAEQVIGLPEWVDAAAVARGQAFLLGHSCELFVALTSILLNGFVLARFSEVLVLSGYVRSPEQTYQRFYNTSVHIWRWLRHSLTDAASPARASLLRTRALHGFARRWAGKQSQRWRADVHGVPLSQLDVALVLLGFSGVVLRGMAKYGPFGLAPTAAQRADVVHTWRLIGWQLGLRDEYNPCASAADNARLVDEFYAVVVPACMRSAPDVCAVMASSTVAALGRYTLAMPADLFAAIMYIDPLDTLHFDRAWSRVPPPPPAATRALDAMLRLRTSSPAFRRRTNATFLRVLDFGEHWPRLAPSIGRVTNTALRLLLVTVLLPVLYICSLIVRRCIRPFIQRS